MQKEVFEYIIKSFKDQFKFRDYFVEYKPYEDYFTNEGKRDKRRKYFNIKIVLKNLRKFDPAENTRIKGETFSKAAKIMMDVEEKYEDITFIACSYNGDGFVDIKFCSVSEVALRELTSGTNKFNVERW